MSGWGIGNVIAFAALIGVLYFVIFYVLPLLNP